MLMEAEPQRSTVGLCSQRSGKKMRIEFSGVIYLAAVSLFLNSVWGRRNTFRILEQLP
jgi:hypothetical protein